MRSTEGDLWFYADVDKKSPEKAARELASRISSVDPKTHVFVPMVLPSNVKASIEHIDGHPDVPVRYTQFWEPTTGVEVERLEVYAKEIA